MATKADILALDFGYITGVDLLDFAPEQLLISQETKNSGIISRSVETAQKELIGKLSSKVDLTSEYEKTATDRDKIVLKLTCSQAIYNISWSLAGEPEKIKQQKKDIDDLILAIREGQSALPLITDAPKEQLSTSMLISSKFKTLG